MPAPTPPPPEAHTRPPWFYHLMAATTVVFWSFSFLHIIWLNDFIDPVSVVVLRKDIFLGLLVGLAIWRRPRLGGLSRRQWVLIIAVSIVAGPAYHFTFAWSAGGGRTTTGLLGLILATMPLHAAWLARIFLQEKLTLLRIGALALGFAGVVVVVLGKDGSLDLEGVRVAGPIAAVGAAIWSALSAILLRGARATLPPLDLFIISGFIMVGIIALFHPFADFSRIGDMPFPGWWAAFYLGIIGSGIAYLTWTTALSGLPALTVAMYLFVSSVLATIWGWLFRGEVVNWFFALGAAMVFAGLVLPLLPRSSRSAPATATPEEI